MSAAVYAHKHLYPPNGHCSHCDWYLTDVTPAKLRREVRKHVLATGHLAWIDYQYSWRYEVTA